MSCNCDVGDIALLIKQAFSSVLMRSLMEEVPDENINEAINGNKTKVF